MKFIYKQICYLCLGILMFSCKVKDKKILQEWKQVGDSIYLDTTIAFLNKNKFITNEKLLINYGKQSLDTIYDTFITYKLKNSLWQIDNEFVYKSNHLDKLIDVSNNGKRMVSFNKFSSKIETYQYIDSAWKKHDEKRISEKHFLNTLQLNFNKNNNTFAVLFNCTKGNWVNGNDSSYVGINVYDWKKNTSIKQRKTLFFPKDTQKRICLNEEGTLLGVGFPENNNNGPSSGKIEVYKYEKEQWKLLGNKLYRVKPYSELGKTLKFDKNNNIKTAYKIGYNLKNNIWVKKELTEKTKTLFVEKVDSPVRGEATFKIYSVLNNEEKLIGKINTLEDHMNFLRTVAVRHNNKQIAMLFKKKNYYIKIFTKS